MGSCEDSHPVRQYLRPHGLLLSLAVQVLLRGVFAVDTLSPQTHYASFPLPRTIWRRRSSSAMSCSLALLLTICRNRSSSSMSSCDSRSAATTVVFASTMAKALLTWASHFSVSASRRASPRRIASMYNANNATIAVPATPRMYWYNCTSSDALLMSVAGASGMSLTVGFHPAPAGHGGLWLAAVDERVPTGAGWRDSIAFLFDLGVHGLVLLAGRAREVFDGWFHFIQFPWGSWKVPLFSFLAQKFCFEDQH